MSPKTDRTLTDADLETIINLLAQRPSTSCNHTCTFSPEEALFLRSWLETAKTAKSEIVRWIIKTGLWLVGIICGIVVSAKLGLFKGHFQ